MLLDGLLTNHSPVDLAFHLCTLQCGELGSVVQVSISATSLQVCSRLVTLKSHLGGDPRLLALGLA